MKTQIFLLSIVIVSSPAFAANHGVGGGYGIIYGCNGPDGVPITDQTSIDACCNSDGTLKTGGNLPAECTTSLTDNLNTETLTGAVTSLHTAQHALNTAKDLSGATTDYKGDGPPKADTSAITAGSGMSAGSGVGENGNGFNAPSGNAASAGGSGGGLGGGAGSAGLGSTSTMSNEKKADGEAKGPDEAGAYAKSGGKDAAGDSKGGLGGFNFGSLFGDGKKADGDGNTNLNFAGDEAASGKDPSDMSGSSVDPSDYFNRIDKSANLFKVVTIRYGKEILKKRVGNIETAKLSP